MKKKEDEHLRIEVKASLRNLREVAEALLFAAEFREAAGDEQLALSLRHYAKTFASWDQP